MASLAAGHALPTGFHKDADNVGVKVVRHGQKTITRKLRLCALGDHEIQGSVCVHFDGYRTFDYKIVGKHLRSQGLDEFNELAKRIGFYDQPRNIAR